MKHISNENTTTPQTNRWVAAAFAKQSLKRCKRPSYLVSKRDNFMLFSYTSRLQLQCLSYYNSKYKSLHTYRYAGDRTSKKACAPITTPAINPNNFIAMTNSLLLVLSMDLSMFSILKIELMCWRCFTIDIIYVLLFDKMRCHFPINLRDAVQLEYNSCFSKLNVFLTALSFNKLHWQQLMQHSYTSKRPFASHYCDKQTNRIDGFSPVNSFVVDNELLLSLLCIEIGNIHASQCISRKASHFWELSPFAPVHPLPYTSRTATTTKWIMYMLSLP